MYLSTSTHEQNPNSKLSCSSGSAIATYSNYKLENPKKILISDKWSVQKIKEKNLNYKFATIELIKYIKFKFKIYFKIRQTFTC